MKKYIIMWDNGFGSSYAVVEAADADDAGKIAYENAREDFEQQADYRCLGEATPELLEEYEGDL